MPWIICEDFSLLQVEICGRLSNGLLLLFLFIYEGATVLNADGL